MKKSLLEEMAATHKEKNEKRKVDSERSGYSAGWIDCLLYLSAHGNTGGVKWEREFTIRDGQGNLVHCGVKR
jgi:hypothetical protein